MIAPTPAQAAARRLQFVDLPRRTHEAIPYEQRPQGAKIPPAKRGAVFARVVELRKQGLDRLEIARLAGVSRRTVSTYLGRAGVPFTRGRPSK